MELTAAQPPANNPATRTVPDITLCSEIQSNLMRLVATSINTNLLSTTNVSQSPPLLLTFSDITTNTHVSFETTSLDLIM